MKKLTRVQVLAAIGYNRLRLIEEAVEAQHDERLNAGLTDAQVQRRWARAGAKRVRRRTRNLNLLVLR